MTAEEREENDITRKRENNMKEQSKLSIQKPSKQVGPLTVVYVAGRYSMLLVVFSTAKKENLFCCFRTSLNRGFFLISENKHFFRLVYSLFNYTLINCLEMQRLIARTHGTQLQKFTATLSFSVFN
jgi:hypothetical protein